ncbi:hypothetical protein HLB44_09360 [Aquincola sp. S2]|uniref:Uncharacterized protein n=1 Tax=Pseudaquabacterium terrae TaxID=2732868 RepID=A0ABX2EEZ5_9BURK|nr:hypothetical protein [Aquabacterium terrae]NRF67189.1 hypothetical protein [Aquabacterium terrae]
MKQFPHLLASSILALAAAWPGTAIAAQTIDLVFNGIPAANVSTPPATPAFADWCASSCFPTTQFPVYAATGNQRGTAYVWGKSFAFGSGGSLCFSEFIAFALNEGDLHVVSGVNGTCGAPIDPALKPPLHADKGALVVIAGGGDGIIAGGTGKFKRWTGTFTDRVFVGFGAPTSGVGGIIYYDQLWFRVTPD